MPSAITRSGNEVYDTVFIAGNVIVCVVLTSYKQQINGKDLIFI
jgi:hypothetical protein